VNQLQSAVQDGWMARARALFAAALLVLAAGCATTGGADPRDPAEGFNRSMFAFNEAFDDAVAKPVATAYKSVAPDPVRTWIRNFFANLGDVFIGVNNLLQGKPGDAVTDWARFAFNSTIGLFGINDVASEAGLEKHNEDFGQTFGRWGSPSGAYLVWPFFGSSTVRDTAGGLVDFYLDPVWRKQSEGVRWGAGLLRATSLRADLLDASRILEEAALDKYVFQRDAYLQRRRGLIYDGKPPREPSSSVREEPRAAVAPAADRVFDEPAGAVPVAASPDAARRVPDNQETVLAAGHTGR
jgi:phospholipid-binding lipoprotein MlaA